MHEAWEITTSDNRIENQTTIFIIFCEDQNDEFYYFRSFQVDNKVKINCIPNQRKAKLNLLSTLEYCNSEGLLDCIDHIYQIKEGVTENIWCVYDRDLEHTNMENIKPVDNLNFSTAIDIAKKAGIKVAWSNDSFELWVLLHFELVPNIHKLHRDYIYNRLTDILQIIPTIKSAYSVLIDNKIFNYKIHLKRREAFLTHILPLLKEKMELAIENAKILEKVFEGCVPYHDCNPCTKVHHLVSDLVLAQK